MKLVQVKLTSGKTVRTCWVEPKVKLGNDITLKNSDEPDRLWRVESIGTPREAGDIHSDWNVGGVTSRR